MFEQSRWIAGHRFDDNKLEKAIISILNDPERGLPNDEPLRDPLQGSNLCRVFVTATIASSGDVTLLRTYDNHNVDARANPCTIVQAARATSAAPSYFPPVEFGVPKMMYLDGGLSTNNPSQNRAVREAASLWGRSIGCLLSLGTGAPPPPQFGQSWFSNMILGSKYDAALLEEHRLGLRENSTKSCSTMKGLDTKKTVFDSVSTVSVTSGLENGIRNLK